MSLAIIPIKHLSKGKTRLSHRLERRDLQQLCLAMLTDIVRALQQTPSIERVAVVTPDASVAECAGAAGAIALLRDDPGLNESIDAATRELAAPGESTLVILGDVAGALPEEIERLFQSLDHDATGAQVVLAPARDGGTAALLRAPGDAIASRFGPHSGRAHREQAERDGVSFRELPLASLSIDLDRPEDVDDFLEQASGGKETRRVFASLGWKKGDRT
ncbi:MAG: 2-phospho-L-lactate guanylyltransferase [Deltaproteobacteria bacterium]|nr:2-phospho-L-lactate guanylyltransferase [Deltaproteobacteria bacterium]